jgi:hypothetical protein
MTHMDLYPHHPLSKKSIQTTEIADHTDLIAHRIRRTCRAIYVLTIPGPRSGERQVARTAPGLLTVIELAPH